MILLMIQQFITHIIYGIDTIRAGIKLTTCYMNNMNNMNKHIHVVHERN